MESPETEVELLVDTEAVCEPSTTETPPMPRNDDTSLDIQNLAIDSKALDSCDTGDSVERGSNLRGLIFNNELWQMLRRPLT